jgi:hypothetical protein
MTCSSARSSRSCSSSSPPERSSSRRRRASRRRPGSRSSFVTRRPPVRRPRFLIRDRDDKFGTAFDALARATGIRMVRMAVRAPNMNAVCERFLGSLRRECLDHVLVLDSRQIPARPPSTSATTTPRALTKGSTSRPRSPQSALPRGTSWPSQCSAAPSRLSKGRMRLARTPRVSRGSVKLPARPSRIEAFRRLASRGGSTSAAHRGRRKAGTRTEATCRPRNHKRSLRRHRVSVTSDGSLVAQAVRSCPEPARSARFFRAGMLGGRGQR